MSDLQPNWCLKIDLQKVDQHAGDNERLADNMATTGKRTQPSFASFESFSFKILVWETVIFDGMQMSV